MSSADQNMNRNMFRVIWFIFIFFIFYGTLIPFNLSPDSGSITSNISNIGWIPFIDSDGSRASIPDMLQNILFFLPFGFFGALSVNGNSKIVQIIKITLLGSLLSGIVELLQLFTNDRTTSITDLLTNSAGAFIGAFFAFVLVEFFSKSISIARFQQFREDKYFFLVIITSIVVAVSALQPFDFTLDVGSVGSKIKSLIKNPVKFSDVLSDEGVAFIRLFFLGYVWSLWLKRLKVQYFYVIGLFFSSILGLFFEGCQIIVQSRMPNIQDALVIILASSCGALFSLFRLTNIPGKIWAIAIILAIWISAGMQMLSPFQFDNKHGGFNWVPFLAYYERTTFIALANFMESMLIYFPMGFILKYIYYRDDRLISLIVFGAIGMIISLSLEFMQIWVAGRYADITDILGAIAGTVAGALVCWHWKMTFKTSFKLDSNN